MDNKTKRDMTIWEAADIVAATLNDDKHNFSTQERKALEVALFALKHKADHSYCQARWNPDGTHPQCILPFSGCIDCPISRDWQSKHTDEELVKTLIDMGWEEVLVPDYKERLQNNA